MIMDLMELYDTKEGRYQILIDILEKDNLSITDIVNAKEVALNEKLLKNNIMISGLALRSTVMFLDKPKDLLNSIEKIKPLVALDIIESGVIKDTPFEKELIEKYQF